MSQTLSELEEAHTTLRELLDVLDAQLHVFRRGDVADYVLMNDIVDIMVHYGDVLHHPTEDLLFRQLAKRDPGAASAVDRLVEEHRVIEEEGLDFLAYLGAVSNGSLLLRQTLDLSARAYIEQLRRHLDKEERELFPLIRKHVTQADWEQIEQETQTEERRLIKEKAAESLRSVMRQIERSWSAK
jgi:hemerythrin-like domain-containing protein